MTRLAGMRGLIGRHGRLLRVTGAMLATLFLMSFAVVNYEALVAQEAGVGIRLIDLSEYPTHLTVDGFDVELTNLTSVVAYEVVVSSDSARVGIGGCGTASQQVTVTGVAARKLSFAVYACAVGEATVTAEVRRAGASSPEASISRELEVEALPEIVIGPKGERIRTTTTPGVSGQGTAETAAQGRSATTSQAPKVGTPGIVPRATIEFNDIKATSVRVRWGQPSSGGPGIKLTGFGLKFWKDEIQEPSYDQGNLDIVGPPPPNRPSEYTKTGLEPNKLYNFRIHACNGEDSCGYWTNPALQFRTPPRAPPTPTPTPTSTPGRPTAPHTIRFESIGTTSFTVTWRPDSKTGGTALTGFGILVGEMRGNVPDWSASTTKWAGKSARAQDVTRLDDLKKETELKPGTTYVVKIKSCNGAGGRTSCGNWSVDSHVTTANSSSKLAKPTNLRLVPGSPYLAKLVWDHTPPDNVKVSFWWESRVYYSSSTSWEQTAEINKQAVLRHDRTIEILDLTNILRGAGAQPIGLKQSPHRFEMRVKATAPSSSGYAESAYSDSIIVIDTPIVRGRGSNPQLHWIKIGEIIPGYADTGDYTFNYRQFAGDHRHAVFWEPTHNVFDKGDQTFDRTGEVFDQGSSGQVPYRDLVNRGDVAGKNHQLKGSIAGFNGDKIYAIQLVYSESGKPTVYAAKDFYVWTSDSRASDNSRIANIPVTYALHNKSYDYHICDETFPSDTVSEWRKLVRHALEQWEAAASQWGEADRLISVTYHGTDCVTYDYFIDEVVGDIVKYQKDQEDLGNIPTPAEYVALLTRLIDGLTGTNMMGMSLKKVQDKDFATNEVKFEDDEDFAGKTFTSVGVFGQFAHNLGYAWCWQDGASGCAAHTSFDGRVETDIFLSKRQRFNSVPVTPGGDIEPNRADVYYQDCSSKRFDAYVTVVHEAGHAMGLYRHGSNRYERHPSIFESILTTHRRDSATRQRHAAPVRLCGPSAFDVLGLRALYDG